MPVFVAPRHPTASWKILLFSIRLKNNSTTPKAKQNKMNLFWLLFLSLSLYLFSPLLFDWIIIKSNDETEIYQPYIWNHMLNILINHKMSPTVCHSTKNDWNLYFSILQRFTHFPCNELWEANVFWGSFEVTFCFSVPDIHIQKKNKNSAISWLICIVKWIIFLFFCKRCRIVS